MKKILNKLGRDNIIQILDNKKARYSIKTLLENDYKSELGKKLVEEANEVAQAEKISDLIEEIGDVYTVLEAIEAAYNLNKSDILKIKEEKETQDGQYEKRLFIDFIDQD